MIVLRGNKTLPYVIVLAIAGYLYFRATKMDFPSAASLACSSISKSCPSALATVFLCRRIR